MKNAVDKIPVRDYSYIYRIKNIVGYCQASELPQVYEYTLPTGCVSFFDSFGEKYFEQKSRTKEIR